MKPASPQPPAATGTVIGFALLVAGLTFALFLPVVGHDFINFDDPEYITKNSRIAAGLTLDNIRWAFTTWHPLTWLSLLLDVNLSGTGPRGFHLTNLLLHTLNSALVLLVLHQLTGALWRSVIVAMLFAWHPVQVESVAWVAERKGLLSTCFGLLAIWAYAKGVMSEASQGVAVPASTSPWGSRFRWWALGFFVLALLSKPMLVTLPLLLLLLDFWPLGRISLSGWRDKGNPASLQRRVLEKLPFFALSVLSAGATSLFQKQAGALQTLGGYSFASRLENFFIGYAHYLGKTLWPTALATPYPRVFHWPMGWVALALVLVGGLSVGVVWWAKKRSYLFTGWFWFFSLLLPVIGLLQVGAAAVADRYAYLPMLGLFTAGVWSAHEGLKRWKLPKLAPVVIAAAVLVPCAARTRDQLRYWQNSSTLFEHAVVVSRDNWIAHQLLGVYYDELGRKEEAFQNFKRATEIKPNYAEAWNSLGIAWTERKDFAHAATCFAAAARLAPETTLFRYNLARAFGVQGRAEEAIVEYRAVLQRDPELATAHYDLGVLLAKTGRLDDAVFHLRETLRLQANQPVAHYHLGKILAAGGNKTEASTHLRAAVQLKPDFAQAREALRALEGN